MNKKMFEQFFYEKCQNNDVRANLIRWIPFDRCSDVLEIGADSYVRSAEIASKVNSLTCLTSDMRPYHVDCDNTVVVHNSINGFLRDCEEKYDVILLINVLEHTEDLCDSAEVLLSCKKHLKEDGQIIIACDNSLGMRYWAGQNQSDRGDLAFFARIQGEQTNKSRVQFTKHELECLIAKADLKYEEFYYPYPCTSYSMAIYSDSYLPHKGELNINDYSMGTEYMKLFDVTKAFDTVLEQGMFPFFSNSFMVYLHV